jgi:hypothetical protein
MLGAAKEFGETMNIIPRKGHGFDLAIIGRQGTS